MGSGIDVPTIDVTPLWGRDRDRRLAVARQIDGVCSGSGFFYVAGHGVDLGALERVTSQLHATVSAAEKWRLAIQAYNSASPRARNGYYLAIPGKKANESYCYLNPSFTDQHPRIAARTPLHEVNVWPDERVHPNVRAFYEAYYWSMFRLSSALLRGFALALGELEDFFESRFTAADTLSAVSLIRYPYLEAYPPVKQAPDGTRLSFDHHRDASLITVLYQTPVPNLQVETADGYRDLPTSADCLLVNCGTAMAHLTGGYYPAPVHRVAFVNAERLSIPFFAHLGYDSVLSRIGPGEPPAGGDGPALRYGSYLQQELHDLIVSNGQT